MSVPLIYTMTAQDSSVMYEYDWRGLAAVVAVGWLVTFLIIRRSATVGPIAF